MTTKFLGPNPWPEITKAVKTRGPRYVAVAYLGVDAPRLLPLKSRDVLVVNASDRSIRAHATSPDAIEEFIERGVRVVSVGTLHAKVIATELFAVVGSANASANSERADEATIITDQKSVINQVRDFVMNLIAQSTELDANFLVHARKVWNEGQGADIVGVAGQTTPEPDFLPVPITRVFLDESAAYKVSEAEKKIRRQSKVRARSSTGPREKYWLDWFRYTGAAPFRVGDVLFLAHTRTLARGRVDTVLHPPAVVKSDAIPIPGGNGDVGFVLSYRTADVAIPMDEANQRLRDTGASNPRLDYPRQVTGDTLRSSLFALWKIDVT